MILFSDKGSYTSLNEVLIESNLVIIIFEKLKHFEILIGNILTQVKFNIQIFNIKMFYYRRNPFES